MKEKRLSKKSFSTLSLEEKVAFVFLMILGGGGIILGLLSFGADIRRPFEIRIADFKGKFFYSSEERKQKEIAVLKNRDSDQDGLSDYDEINVFKTSAYLSDTDSDGVDDKTEIYNGENPNCPSGQVCNGENNGENLNQEDNSKQVISSLEQVSNSNVNLNNLSKVKIENVDDIKNFFAEMSPEEIRAMLIQQGIPKNDVDKLSDEEIKDLLAESLKKALADKKFNQVLSPDIQKIETE